MSVGDWVGHEGGEEQPSEQREGCSYGRIVQKKSKRMRVERRKRDGGLGRGMLQMYIFFSQWSSKDSMRAKGGRK